MHATRAANQEGILPGGGVALLRAAQDLKGEGVSDDEKIGYDIVVRACRSPIQQIAENAGEDGAVVMNRVLENKDKAQHTVGIRVMIDTLIGANDGVPFLVPGLSGLVKDKRDFATPREVPDFIQALEKPFDADQLIATVGTVARNHRALDQIQ